MIAVQTDMAIPKDVDSVRVEISAYGDMLFGNDYDVGPSGLRIPATLAVVAGEGASVPIRIRVISRQGGKLRTLRESVTTVPKDRIATLRMPIQWLCDGQAKEIGPGQVEPTCPPGETCIAGRCLPVEIDSATLDTYTPQAVFGGGSGAGDGECFDTVPCFSEGGGAPVDLATCSIPIPAGGSGTNVALVMPPGSAGICGPEACLIPLDADSDTGWHEEGGRIILPPAVCDRLSTGAIVSVALTTSCETKTASIPTCGPWSSVNDKPGEFDAGAPDVAEIVSDASDEEGGLETGADTDAEGGSPTCASFYIDTSACEPVGGAGCAAGTVCAVVSETATGCVAENPLSASHGQGWPCQDQTTCADGTYCTGTDGICATYCCDVTDCTPLGAGLSCKAIMSDPDGGNPKPLFGVCQP